MNARLLMRTSAFRLALVYAALFVVSALVLFAILYWATIGSVGRQIDATIESEILGLAEQYERRGVTGLVDVLAERVRRSPDGGAIYLFADSNLSPLAGNLRRWPTLATDSTGQIEFDTTHNGAGVSRFRANILSVGRDYRLLVGRDLRELTELKVVFERAAVWGIAVVLILAIAGGALMSASAQRRIAIINRTARQIMDGELNERIPITGSRDEYHDLAIMINDMLSKIEILLDNVRHVGDSVAHDLKTPLTRLRNRLESLSHTELSMSSELEKCVAESDQLLATFNALLRIARIESGAYRTAFSTLNVMELVDGVCELYRATADEKRVTLSIVSKPEVLIYGDRDLLTQAFANLLDNAVKYTPYGGSISIDINELGGQIELAVSDSGGGVPAVDHLRIQQRFVRLDTARSEPGNGLGLSLVKAVVDQHKGELRTENLDPGLRMTMILPRDTGDTRSPASGL